MLYELVAVVRTSSLNEIKEIAKSAGMTVLQNGGVVRGYTYWEKLMLPTRRRAHLVYHTHGQYFIMRFDSNSPTQHLIQRTLRLDPRMISFSVVKMGTKLKDVAKVKGKTWDLDLGV
ncbi:unnamed protein product [Tuber melanosporum]|jgi:small subunit ribosomal protein S6|uniref:(Perigord truffle) hypothetical protein n=1 Tax=Tuber melanosporum (strain Mel28) TaxID=656061 RepID=D5GLE9_TUBMM|nr:mitochondrial 37S ribosomal protein YmS16 [Tuber melanosporum]KAG0127074.1 hypothetical protein HOY82DRAFT_614046 [Tuber indicum]CAZ85342.1 unnamed protein product [Tuber melanosporum]